jgi:hypothetical protein
MVKVWVLSFKYQQSWKCFKVVQFPYLSCQWLWQLQWGGKKSYDIRHNGFISLADENDKTRDTTLKANCIIFSLSRAHYSRATALERRMLQSSWWLILIRQRRSQYRKYFVHTCRSQVAKLPFRCHFQRDVQHLTWRSVAEKTKKAIDRNRCSMIRTNLLIAINVKWFLRKPLR